MPNVTKTLLDRELEHRSKRLSKEAVAVLQALQQTVEPDELLFTGLPQACGLPAIGTDEADDGSIAKNLRTRNLEANINSRCIIDV